MALCNLLQSNNWKLKSDIVQDCWNEFKYKLVRMVDIGVLVKEFHNNSSIKSERPAHIKK
jgi:hypothetical protein